MDSADARRKAGAGSVSDDRAAVASVPQPFEPDTSHAHVSGGYILSAGVYLSDSDRAVFVFLLVDRPACPAYRCTRRKRTHAIKRFALHLKGENVC